MNLIYPILHQIVAELAVEHGWHVQATSRGDVLRISDSHHGAHTFIHGCKFGLNSSSTHLLISDKSALSQVLNDAEIPNVPHALFPGVDAQYILNFQLLRLAGVVIKDNDGSRQDVYLAFTKSEITQAITKLREQGKAVAVSPYEYITDEYRVVVLDDAVELVYRKMRGDNWQHNLSSGALPELVSDDELLFQLKTLAIKAAQEVKGRFVSVDIVMVGSQKLKVLEINSGIMMEYFAGHSPQVYAKAKRIYKKALRKALAL